MAKKKKSKGAVGMSVPSMSSGERMSTDISTAENGFIVNVSGETGGKNPSYFSKRFVASSRPQALRIAAHHISGSGALKGKAGKKKSKGLSLKKSLG
jgi:hypothetical protein